MNLFLEWITEAAEIGMYGFVWAIEATRSAALLAGVVLLASLLLRKWLTAGQKNLLWGLVLVRLLMPLAPASVLSLQNLSLPASVYSVPNESAAWLPTEDGAENATDRSGLYAVLKDLMLQIVNTEHRSVGNPSVAEWIATGRSPVAQAAQPEGFAWEELLWLVWLCAAGLILCRTAIVHFRFSRRAKRGSICAEPRIVELWTACRALARVRRAIPIVCCDEVRQPALMGLWRPKLLLPSDVTKLDGEPLRMIMLHELAHVRRRDIAFNWVMVLIRAVHWWNPVYWLAASRFASLREQACDAFVMRHVSGERKRDYSELLLTLAGRETAGGVWRVTLPASILGFLSSMFRQRAIRQRLRALRLDALKPSPVRTGLATAAIVLVAIGGFTDAVPPAEIDHVLDWVPPITMSSSAPPADDGPLVTHVHDLTGVLARIEADASLLPDAAGELKWLIEEVLQIKRLGFNADDSVPTPSSATYTLEGMELTVSAPESLHAKLAERLQVWQQSGFGQIAVGCEFYHADRDVASAAGISWRLEETHSAGSALNPPDFLPSSTNSPPHAAASVVENCPVLVATLGKQQVETFLRAVHSQPRGQQYQALKVTVCNGQPATIGEITQTPFVVGLQKRRSGWEEPLIKIFEDGTTLSFRAVHSSDRRRIRLKGGLGISKLGEVREVRATCNGMPAIVQAPSAKRWQIDFDSTVEEGQSVLIGFVPTYERPLVVYALLTVQTVVPDASVAAR